MGSANSEGRPLFTRQQEPAAVAVRAAEPRRLGQAAHAETGPGRSVRQSRDLLVEPRWGRVRPACRLGRSGGGQREARLFEVAAIAWWRRYQSALDHALDKAVLRGRGEADDVPTRGREVVADRPGTALSSQPVRRGGRWLSRRVGGRGGIGVCPRRTRRRDSDRRSRGGGRAARPSASRGRAHRGEGHHAQPSGGTLAAHGRDCTGLQDRSSNGRSAVGEMGSDPGQGSVHRDVDVAGRIDATTPPLALRAVVASRARCDPPPLVALRRADVDDRRELAVVPGENPPNQDRAAFLAAVIDERAESVTVPERVNVPLPSPPRTESDAGVLPVR
jgi:hypothetical protein